MKLVTKESVRFDNRDNR